MNEFKNCIEIFDRQIANAHTQVQSVICEISHVQENILSYVQDFCNRIHGITFQANNQFERELQDVLSQYQKQSDTWCQEIRNFIEGQEFVNQFETSILVVVFGNVNVGKSSIGNLIAGVTDSNEKDDAQLQKNLRDYFGEPPVFFEYDLAGQSNARGSRPLTHGCFQEGYVETTANIQYFTRKDGLTWTDSPGVCSVTKINGDLAKKYVEFADLVIFVTTSSSPAKFDEVQELKKLFCDKKKPMLILINKSDQIDKDEVDGQLVRVLRAKSDDDRKKQENYTQEAFSKEAGEIVESLDAMSISTYLALNAIKAQNFDTFQASGYPRFLKKLGDTCSEQAVNLKMLAPKNRVFSVIQTLLTGDSGRIMGIKQYQENMQQIMAQIKKAKTEMEQSANDVIPQIVNQAMNEIISYIQDSSREIRNGGSVTLDDTINNVITEKVVEALKVVVKSVLEDDVNTEQTMSSYKGISGINLATKMESFERTVYETKTVSRDPKGLIENLQHIFLDKQFTTTKIKTRTITETFANGDNSTEAIEAISAKVKTTIGNYVQVVIQELQHNYFAKEEEMINNVLLFLNELEQKLVELQKGGNL